MARGLEVRQERRRGVATLVAGVLLIAVAATGHAASAQVVPPSSTTTEPVTTTTALPEGDAASLELVEGTELACEPAVTQVTDTYRVTKASWAADLVVIPEVVADGQALAFVPAELGPGVMTATATITFQTTAGHPSRGATGTLVVRNADGTPAAFGDVPVGFVGSIYCPQTTTSTTVVPPVPQAATPVVATARYTG